MIKEVIHIGITVTDIDKSLDFYENILDLSFQGEMFMEGKETDMLFGIKDCKVKVAYLNGNSELLAPAIELLEFVSYDTKLSNVALRQTLLTIHRLLHQTS